MKIQFNLVIGKNNFLITEEAENQAEFVEKMAFFTKIPKVGPNGEDDLEMVFRTTSQGHKYYSLVSKKADQEFMFGQSQKRPGELFEKGWQPLYKPENNQNAGNNVVPQNVVPQNTVPQQAQAPVQQPVPQAPIPQPQNIPQAPAQQPVPQAPAQQAQAPAVTPQQAQTNNAAATDILSQFGITN